LFISDELALTAVQKRAGLANNSRFQPRKNANARGEISWLLLPIFAHAAEAAALFCLQQEQGIAITSTLILAVSYGL
jgi:hypothetical protein